jgi:phosphopantothenoylcysteine decarboxylase/phosphopantothenate--cysteine ligase
VPPGVEVVETPTAADVERETVGRGAEADLVLMAAAVADYRPAGARGDKRPKDGETWAVELEPTTDVLRALAETQANGRVTVGFAAETGAGGLARAREKLVRKGLDLIVLNDVSRTDVGFDAPDNEVVLVGREGERALDKAPKERVAAAIIDEAVRLLAERHG